MRMGWGEEEKKKRAQQLTLKCIMLFIGIIKLLLLQKGSNKLFRKTNIVANNIFSSSARTVLQNGFYNITVKEFYI